MQTLNSTLFQMQTALNLQTETVKDLRSNLTAQRDESEAEIAKLKATFKSQLDEEANLSHKKYIEVQKECQLELKENKELAKQELLQLEAENDKQSKIIDD